MYRNVFGARQQLCWVKFRSSATTPRLRSIAASVAQVRSCSAASKKFTLDQIIPSSDAFSRRHIGPDAGEEREMLKALNLEVSKMPRVMNVKSHYYFY